MKRVAIFALLSCLIAAASATNSESFSFPPKAIFGQRGQSVDVKPIAPFASDEGENLAAFLLRAAILFRGFTADSGFEACSAICMSPSGQYGVFLITNESHIGCTVVNVCQHGMTATGESIHSHPQQDSFVVNRADKVFAEARDDSAIVIARGSILRGSAGHGFSETDYEGGPGYLVDGNILRYQKGSGTSRDVGVLPPAE